MEAKTIAELQVVISAQNKQMQQALREIYSELDKTAAKAQAANNKMAAGFEKINSVATKALKWGVAGAIGAVAASIPGAVRRIDTLVAFPRMLEAMGSSADEAQKATDRLATKLRGLPTPLQDGAAGVQALVAAGLEVPHATEAYLAFNNAMLAANVEAGAAQATFIQLTQAISRGKIEGQEWNSITANMPNAMQMLQKESGKTKLELQELYRTNPQKLLDDLIRLNTEGSAGLASLEEQARAATGGIGTAFSNLKNSITRGIEGIVRALGNGDLEAGQRKISDAISALGKAFGEALLAVGALVTFIADNSTVFGMLAAAIGGSVAAIVAYSTYVKVSTLATAAFSAASTYLTLVQSLQAQGLGLLRAAWMALNIVMAANPIGIVIVAVAGLTAALAWFVTQTETGRQIFETAMNAIKSAAQTVWNWLKSNWPLLLTILTGPVGLAVVAIVKNLDTIKAGFSNALNFVKGIWSGITGFFSGVTSSIGNSFDNVVGYARNAFNNVVNAIKSIDWSGIGMDIIRGIGSGIASMGGWLADKAKAAVGGAKDKLKSFLGIHSPSRVMRDEIGKMIGMGIAVGIDDSAKFALKSASNMSSSLVGALDRDVSMGVNTDMRARMGSGRGTPVNVNLDGRTLLSFVVDGINDSDFMSNTPSLNV